MARRRRHRCRQCGKLDEEVGPLSSRALCMQCAMDNMRDVQLQLTRKSGPVWNKYVQKHAAGMAAYARRYDEQQPQGKPPAN